MTKVLYLHGWHSNQGGIKPTFLKERGFEVLNPQLSDDSFEDAVTMAQVMFITHQPDVVIGSSRGGAVAMNIDTGNAQLILLCPSWKRFGTANTVKPGTILLHSREDEVVLYGDSEELARASQVSLIETGHDHRLADRETLQTMLGFCLDPFLTHWTDLAAD